MRVALLSAASIAVSLSLGLSSGVAQGQQDSDLDPGLGLEGGADPFGEGNQLGANPTPQFGLGELLDDEGNFTWNDGEHDNTLQLIDSPSPSEQAELAQLGVAAAQAYPEPAGELAPGGNDTSGGTPARGNWFRSDTGQLFQLVGGVNVIFSAAAGRQEIDAILTQLGVFSTDVEELPGLPNGFWIVTRSDRETLTLTGALAAVSLVEAVEPNLYTPHTVGDEQTITNIARADCTKYSKWLTDALSSCQWNLNADSDFHYWYRNTVHTPTIDINIGDIWETSKGAGVTVAVVDQTWDPTHVDLKDNIDDSKSTHFRGLRTQTGARNNHGTKVAGVIGMRDNAIGGRGVAPRATLINFNYLDAQSSNNLWRSLVTHKAQVAVSNHSYGASSNNLSRMHYLEARGLRTGIYTGFGGKGTSYVYAAGNGKGSTRHPGNGWAPNDEINGHVGVITVCAVDWKGVQTSYSEEGPVLWVCAPSEESWTKPGILTTIGSKYYDSSFGGTSAAAPHVTGVIALMRAANKNLTWRDVKLILANTAQKNHSSDSSWQTGALKYGSSSERYHYSNRYGFGLVDAEAAVTAAQNWPLVPSQQQSTVITSANTSVGGGQEVTLPFSVTTSINFIEHVNLSVNMTAPDFRKLRLTLVSPSGAESILAKEWLSCKPVQCGLNGSFTFGSARHLGENPNGSWKLKIRNFGTDAASLRSWTLRTYGHLSSTASVPSVGISGGAGVTEGTAAQFTLTASPAPSAPLTVKVGISQRGSVLGSTATRSVVIPTSGSVTFTVDTATDTDPERDGSVTANVQVGSGYKTGSPSSATVPVSDDDGGLPTVSISAGDPIVEGNRAEFTVNVSPAPTTSMTVHLVANEPTGEYVIWWQDDIGERRVSVDTTGTAKFYVQTRKRVADDPNSAITARIIRGSNYEIGTPSSGDVVIQNGDGTTPVITVTGRTNVTEGTDLAFRLEATPAPKSPLTINVSRVQVGSFVDSSHIGDTTVVMSTSGTAILTIPTIDDKVIEDNGTFTFKILSGSNYTVGSPSSVTRRIADNDTPLPIIAISGDTEVTEGQPATFTLTVQDPHKNGNRVFFDTSQVGDFAQRTLGGTRWYELQGNAKTASFTISTVDDQVSESDGSITFTLRDSEYYTVGSPSSHTVIVKDNDSTTPSLTVTAGGNVTEGADAVFALTATPAPKQSLTVDLRVLQVGSYVASSAIGLKQVTIDTTGTATYRVSTIDDTVIEADGTVTVLISPSSAYRRGTPNTASVAVADDDTALPAKSCVTTDASLLAQVAAKVARHGTTGRADLLAMFTSAHNTMLGTEEYTVAKLRARPDKQSANWNRPGPNALWQSIYTELDRLETCRSSTTPQPQPQPPPQQTPSVSISAGSGITEGGTATFTLTATPAPSSSIAVTVSVTQNGSFVASGQAGTRTVTIDSTGSGTLSVTTVDDGTDEPNGSISAAIQSGSKYNIGTTSSASVSVADNDPPPVVLSTISIYRTSPASGITEGGTATFALTAGPRPASSITVTVSVADSGSFANAGQAGNRTVVIDSTGSGTLSVTTVDDGTDEPNGSISATLQTSGSYIVGTPNSASVSVADDDAPPVVLPTVSISAGSGITEGGTAAFTLTASPRPASSITVTASVADSGSFAAVGQAGTRTVTIDSTGSATLTVTTVGDAIDEPNGTLTATLQAGNSYTVGSASTATVAVADDDAASPSTINLDAPAPSRFTARTITNDDGTLDVLIGWPVQSGIAEHNLTARPRPQDGRSVKRELSYTKHWYLWEDLPAGGYVFLIEYRYRGTVGYFFNNQPGAKTP